MEKIYQKYKKDNPSVLYGGITQWTDNFHKNIQSGIFNDLKSNSIAALPTIIKLYVHDNRPAVLIGASPHLEKNIHHLKQYQSKTIILCCDVALPYVIQCGIIPHIVVTIDPHKIIAQSFNNIDTNRLFLACPTTIHPDTIQTWKGAIFFYNQDDDIPYKKRFFKQLYQQIHYPRIVNRAFVGATMYQICKQFINPSKILLIGYGFANKDGNQYCPGVFEARGMQPIKARKDLTKHLTHYAFKFIETADGDTRVHNCTEGGLLSCQDMKFFDALELYAK